MVYCRCGFSQSQEAYDVAVKDLFSTLDMIEHHLGGSRYLCGNKLTLVDVCLFTTLIRFDLVYNVLFKCTKKKLVEYPHLHGYMRDIYQVLRLADHSFLSCLEYELILGDHVGLVLQIPKVAETCNFAAIMDGYYKTLFPLNPGGIRPAMPSCCAPEILSTPHDRESLSSVDVCVS